tara:strand:+ start:571 stop:1035 length:465 start_codon:yes stop_codon:yes gene_type:complete
MKKINSLIFKKAMSKFTTGITVVTIKTESGYIGKTVNSFTSLSLNPPLILFSLDKKSSSINEYKKSTFFGVNILTKKQKDISKFFSSKKSKWNDTDFFLSKNKVPMIKNCIVNLDCRIKKTSKEGDHILFICKINEISINNSTTPLVYFNSEYK